MSRLFLKTKWAKELLMRQEHITTGTTFYVDAATGNDSGSGLYPFDAKLTIQSAVDAVTSDRGDVVIVGAGRYVESVRITKSKMTLMGAQTGGKESVSIRPGGAWAGGAGGSVVYAESSPVYGYSSVVGVDIRSSAVTINAASVELCGLQFDGSGFKYDGTNWYAYGGVYVGDGTRINASYNTDSNGSYIHDCIFKRGARGIEYDGAAEDHRLTDNLFYRQEGAATKGGVFICPGSSRKVERILIADNVFMDIENTAYGIFAYDDNDTKGVMVLRNAFLDRTDSSMAQAVNYAGDGDWLVAGNYFGCTNEASLASEGWFVGNYEGVAAASGAQTNFVSHHTT